ncbi:MAG: hypothetical protein ACXAC8_19160 [Candidatus Hodarchaeales archaeon]
MTQNNASNADFNIYLEIKEKFEPIRTPHLVIDTTRDLSSILKNVRTYIEKI